MNRAIACLAVALAAASLSACSTTSRWGWTSQRAEATAEGRAECEAALGVIRGGADHRTAMHACLDAKARRPNGPHDPDHGATRPARNDGRYGF